MSTTDKNGSPWAKLSELREGDMIEIDGDFTCHKAGACIVHVGPDGRPWFTCNEGEHYLEGQADDGIHCVGVYKVDR